MQSGQVVRVFVNGAPKRLTVAEVLFEDDNKDLVTTNGIPRDATRWRELLIVRTERGAIAMRSAFRSRWQGEHDSEAWSLAVNEDDAARQLALAAGVSDAQRGDGRHDAGAADGDDIEPALAKRALKDLDWYDRVAEDA